MVIINDEVNEENTTYKKKEESPPVVTEFHSQWQQPSSQGSSGPIPNQWQHYYHPVGSSDPSSTYGISAQREQMKVSGLTNMPVNAGPLQSISTTSDTPRSSGSKQMMPEMPAPGPSKSKKRTSETSGNSNPIPSRSDVPGVSSASSQTIKNTAGKEESLDGILVKEAIATLMGRCSAKNVQMEGNEQKMQREDVDETVPQEQNGEEEENVDGKEEAAGTGDEESNEELNPAPLNFAVPENCDFNALSLELRESILKATGKLKTQVKQRNKACLVGKERTSFNDLPDSVMQMVNNFVAYYYHETSGGFFRSIIEIARFMLREEYPTKGKSLKEDVVPVDQELQVHNGRGRSNVDLDLNAALKEGTIGNQVKNGGSSTSQISAPLKPPHKMLKRKIEGRDCEAATEETDSVLPPNLETVGPNSEPVRELDLPVPADGFAATENLESFMQQLSAFDVAFPTEMNDSDFTYGANHVFDDNDQLIDDIETCESLEDLYNFLHGNNGKKPNNDLP
ncbi:hypothetical protein SLEP1_g17792 [Rubroshorea leprosula]|uniref:Uncharacterized protein n=1 Tax=Rubroshorea leprosula TaxID=152421 RepID=A0AAV5J761_9ROSI|nr:hypothetical protein SLEP1_g17792 [Rubroshorea leprosula]